MEAIRELAPGKLHADEAQIVREAADGLLFCEDLAGDAAAREALDAFHVLVDRLVESERITPERAGRLAAEVEACGPLAAVG